MRPHPAADRQARRARHGPAGTRRPAPCAVADVVTDTTLAVLASGPVPRRTAPFDPRSLAMIDACGLLDPTTVATVPGLETALGERVEPGHLRAALRPAIEERAR